MCMRITLFYVTTPCSLVDRYILSRICCFHPCSTLKTEVTSSSKTLLLFHQTTRRHIFQKNILCVWSQVITEATTKIIVFCDLRPCSLVDVYRYSSERVIIFLSWRWRQHVPRKRTKTSTTQRGVTTHTRVIFSNVYRPSDEDFRSIRKITN
jgi:hypothetical protein